MLRPIFAEDWHEIRHGIADARMVRKFTSLIGFPADDHAPNFPDRLRHSDDVILAIALSGDRGAPIIGLIGLIRNNAEKVRNLECWIARRWQQQAYDSEAIGAMMAATRSLGMS